MAILIHYSQLKAIKAKHIYLYIYLLAEFISAPNTHQPRNSVENSNDRRRVFFLYCVIVIVIIIIVVVVHLN